MSALKHILFVHHNCHFVGSSQSLFLILNHIDRSKYKPSVLITAPKGPFYDKLIEIGVEVFFIDGVVPYGHSNPGKPSFWGYPPFRSITLLFKIPGSIKRVEAFLQQRHFDLVYVNSSVLWPAAAASKKLGFRTIIHVREQISNTGLIGLRKNYFRRSLERHSDSLIVLTQASKDQFRQKEKINVIYNVINPEIFNPSLLKREECRKALGLSDAKYILFVGGVLKHKGGYLLLKAVRQLIDEGRNVKLIVLGHSKSVYAPTRNPIKRLARWIFLKDNAGAFQKLMDELELEKHMVMPGAQSNVSSWMAAANVLVFPSTIDHFGRPIVEATSVHTPSVASNHPSNQELRRLFDSTNLVRLFENKDVSDLKRCLNESLLEEGSVELMGVEEIFSTHGFYVSKQSKLIDAVIRKTLETEFAKAPNR